MTEATVQGAMARLRRKVRDPEGRYVASKLEVIITGSAAGREE